MVDLAVIHAFESGTLELRDFYFTGDDYRYRFEPDAKQRFIDLIRERFNAGVTYKGRALKWDTIFEKKAEELGRFLTAKQRSLDFIEPKPCLERRDDREMRAKILALTASQAERLGIGKSTLHYLHENARSDGSFRTYRKIARKLVL